MKSAKQLITLTTPLNAKLIPTAANGEEHLAGLYSYSIELLSTASELESSALLGKAATLGFLQPDGRTYRYINGIVSSFRQYESTATMNRYSLTLRPTLWLLTRTSDCRVFQRQTVPEIITTLYTAAGGTISNQLTATYDRQEYTVQYNESGFDFITRLLASAGIFYYFEHTATSHTLVLVDRIDSLPASSASPELTCIPAAVSPNPANEISEPATSSQVVSNRYSLSDYNFQTPKSSLTSSTGGGTLELYHHGSGHQNQDTGTTLAGRYLDAAESTATSITATTPASGLAAGATFSITAASRHRLNRSFAVTTLQVAASLEHYTATVTAIPDDQPFALPFSDTPPQIHGTQTALVVGKAGKEIWTDKYGRVRIQFYWDREGNRDEKSGCWVRVAQSWAGKGFGTVFIPRIGQEVVVSFINGDISRPLITGLVYNADQTVPFPLPAAATVSGIRTRSSPGGSGYNALTFEDTQDHELISLHAQKDLNMNINNSRTTTITESDDTLTLQQGSLITEVSKGDYRLTVGGDLTIDVSGKLNINTQKSATLTSSGDFSLTADTALTATGSSFTLTGKTTGKIDGGTSLIATGTLVKIN